jgi:hypothetical protein
MGLHLSTSDAIRDPKKELTSMNCFYRFDKQFRSFEHAAALA